MMCIRNVKILLTIGIAFTSLDARSYELTTHAAMTNRAYAISALGSQSGRLSQLGLVNLKSPFGGNYYDFTSTLVAKRSANAFELSKFVPGTEQDVERINGWFMRGVIREDDGGLAAAIRAGEPYVTDPDPYGLINRFCNHFLDPITRNALNTSLLSEPLTRAGCPNSDNFNAANWAIGASAGGADAFSASPQAVDNFRNHFTTTSAREAMWRALTLKNSAGAPAQRIAGDTDEQTRNAYWANTFRALGNVLHLNQDMAQPQHTRNEAHGLGPSSLFERYVDARATQIPETIFKFDGEGNVFIEQGGLPPLPLNNTYPIPRFNRYSDYWSTDQSSASILAGKGLADYSSRGFFTPAKNLGTSYAGFTNPVNNENAYNITTDPVASTGDCTGYAGRGQYARGSLPEDFLIANDPAIKAKYASRSLVTGQWSLNRCVFEERVDLLIPRAVAYSAGLIDYFFRGQLEIRLPGEGVYAILDHAVAADNCKDTCGFKTIKLKLANSTPDITPSGGGAAIPQAMTGGTLVAVAKYHKNKCYTTDLEGEYDTTNNETRDDYLTRCRDTVEEIAVSQPLSNQSIVACNGADTNTPSDCDTKAEAAAALTFNFTPPIPINATDLYLQVVYRGPLGSEQDAVVVGTKDIAEPTYFAIVNTLDYRVCYNRAWYYKDSSGNLPASIPAMVDGVPKETLYAPTNFDYWRVAFQPNESFVKPPIAKVDNIAPMEFARIAVLIEPGRRYNDEILGYRSPLPTPFTLAEASILQINYTPDGNAHSAALDYKPLTVRKVKATVPLSGYKYNTQTSGGDCTGVALPPEPMFPPYPKPTVMKAVTITLEP